MSVNRDKYVDEIHEIRWLFYEETKHMTQDARDEIVRKNSEEFRRMIEKKRAERLAAK